MEEDKNKTNELPIVPLDIVLDCIMSKDPVISQAGQQYYQDHYINNQ